MAGDSTPWVAAEAGIEAKKVAPAATRNRDAILGVLQGVLPTQGNVLEIASGSGEHIIHFARAMPHLHWQPSDPEPAALASVAAWSAEAALPNIAPPLMLDVCAADWPIAGADAMLCINMIHIAPWEATLGLMARARRLLSPGSRLYLYGPFREAGVPLATSNADFDASLKDRNPQWGLRNVDDVAGVAAKHGLALRKRLAMPANNLSLIFTRE
jgi:SAM-dependent methyltransferase